MVQIFDSDSCGIETVSNRMRGKAGGVLAAIEAFLFNRGDQPAIFDNGCCRVAVISVDAKNVHAGLSV